MSAGLYIHVPFCARVCPYCDFAVTTGDATAKSRYVDVLGSEIRLARETDFVRAVTFDTVYLGGGTPSALTPHEIGEILTRLRADLPVQDDAWITLEANPEDVAVSSAAAWRALDVRTVSLGVQSFDDAFLAHLGRVHSGQQAREAVRILAEAETPRVSIDLMFGIDGQSAARWQQDLDTAIALQPDHVSCYQLTFHEGTPFERWRQEGRRREMPDDEQAKRYAQAHRALGAAGLHAYEVSNFARGAECESRHNRKYWEHAPYLGLGPSAHSFDGGRRRWWNLRDLRSWTSALESGRPPVGGTELLDDSALLLEKIMFGMRCTAGLDLRRVLEEFGVDLAACNAERFAAWRERGLIDGRTVIRPTEKGLAVADWLAAGVRTAPGDPRGA